MTMVVYIYTGRRALICLNPFKPTGSDSHIIQAQNAVSAKIVKTSTIRKQY